MLLTPAVFQLLAKAIQDPGPREGRIVYQLSIVLISPNAEAILNAYNLLSCS